jgi:predicted ATPase/DNA-binding XRE family transcriptional regulator
VVETPTVADLLRKYRSEARLSQEALAERAGLSTRTISDIENGVARWPRAITLSLLSEALRLDAETRDTLRRAASNRTRTASSNVSDAPAFAAPKLIGRETELAAARAVIVDEKARLLTLVGGAGVGKTVLAFALAHAVSAPLRAKALLVELAGLPDSALVPTKIALSAGVRDTRGDSIVASLAAAIGKRPTLLVLDTFEHLLAAAPFVAELLGAIPALSIVATSRLPLHVRGERIVEVRPLELPPERSARLSELERVASVRLLLERAREIDPGFALDEENAAGVAALVRALDGVPLAIELAAPLLRVQSPASLAARLEGALNVLVSRQRDVPRRQQTMRDAIAWSYELLNPEQQHVLRQLAVFPGVFTVEAAQRIVAPDAGDDVLATLRTLAALADQYLARIVDDGDGDPRFELPPLVRQFAAELLAAAGERETLQARLAAYCVEVAESIAAAVAHDRSKLERLRRDSATFEMTLAWMLATRQAALGLQLMVKLRDLWWVRGAGAHGAAWLRSFFDVAEEDAIELDEELLANACWAACGLNEASGATERARYYAELALPLMQARGNTTAVGSLLAGLGVMERARGDLEAARLHLEEALTVRRSVGEPLAIGLSLIDLGWNVAEQGDVLRAESLVNEALENFRTKESSLGICSALDVLALFALPESLERAETLAREGLRIAKEIEYADGLFWANAVLGWVALGRDDIAAATQSLLAAARVAREHAEGSLGAYLLRMFARIAHASGRSGEAARMLGAAATVPNLPDLPNGLMGHEAFVASLRVALGSEFDGQFTIGRATGSRAVMSEVSTD